MPILEVPLPILFSQPDFGILSKEVIIAMLGAAKTIGTKMFMPAADVLDGLMVFSSTIIPLVTRETYPKYPRLISGCDMVEIVYEPGIEKGLEQEIATLRGMKEGLFISCGLPLSADLDYARTAVSLARAGVDTLHVYADTNGREFDFPAPRFIKDMLRDIHLALVDDGILQPVNILSTGWFSLADHVNKAILFVADGVAIYLPIFISLEFMLCHIF